MLDGPNQETHKTHPNQLKLDGYVLADFIPSKHHGLPPLSAIASPLSWKLNHQRMTKQSGLLSLSMTKILLISTIHPLPLQYLTPPNFRQSPLVLSLVTSSVVMKIGNTQTQTQTGIALQTSVQIMICTHCLIQNNLHRSIC